MACECASNSLPTNSSKLLALKTGFASRFPLIRTRCGDVITEALSKKAKTVNAAQFIPGQLRSCLGMTVC